MCAGPKLRDCFTLTVGGPGDGGIDLMRDDSGVGGANDDCATRHDIAACNDRASRGVMETLIVR